MKNKIILSILCIIVLIGVSGCGSKKNSILGTYEGTNGRYNGTLKLYEGGNCYYKEVMVSDSTYYREYSYCNYDVNDNEIIINIKLNDFSGSVRPETCIIEKQNLKCENHTTFIGEWKKN